MVFIFNYELSEDYRHMGGLGCPSYPELHRLLAWSVDDELFVHLVIGSGGLNASSIRPVREFSKGEASDINKVFTVCSIFFVVVSTKVDERLMIKPEVDSELCHYVVVVELERRRHCYEEMQVVDDF